MRVERVLASVRHYPFCRYIRHLGEHLRAAALLNKSLDFNIIGFIFVGSEFTSVGQWWAGCECVLHMDPEERRHLAREHMMVIMNHKYEIDWLMAWILAERIQMLGVRTRFCNTLHGYCDY